MDGSTGLGSGIVTSAPSPSLAAIACEPSCVDVWFEKVADAGQGRAQHQDVEVLPVTHLQCMRALTAGLSALTCSSGLLAAPKQNTTAITMLWSPNREHEQIEVRCSTLQRSWTLKFDPDYDREGRPVVVSLSLVGKRGGDNLFYESPNFHGLQPFNFAARDFLNGVRHAAFGKSRRLTLPNSSGMLLVSVDRAVVKTRKGVALVGALDLTLKLSTGSRSQGCELK